ncbi:MAG: hypothetical protein AB7V18_02240 [Pyrinomonadaceae bacterium]
MTPIEHNRLISIFFYVQGGLQAVGGLALGIIYGVIGTAMLAAAQRDEEQMMGGIFLVLGIVLGALLLVFAAIDIFAATKMRKLQPIGRTVGIVVGCLSLLSFPLGTALGIYTLWFFFGDQGKALYLGADPRLNNFSMPPPPNSWQ